MAAGFPGLNKEPLRYIYELECRIQELEDMLYPNPSEEYYRGYTEGYHEALGKAYYLDPDS